MAAIVTKLNKAKKQKGYTSRQRKALRADKRRAHRTERRADRQALHIGEEPVAVPRLTDWDLT